MSSEPKSWRIAWLIRGDENYGVKRAVMSLVKALCRLGHQPIVLCLSDDGLVSELEGWGAETWVLNVGVPPRLKGGLVKKAGAVASLLAYQRRALRSVVKAIQATGAHAVHVLWPNLVGLAAKAGHVCGIPCLWEMPNVVGTGAPVGLSRWYYNRLCRRWGVCALANSRYTAASLGRGAEMVRLMHLGVDKEYFDPCRRDIIGREELGISSSAIIFGVVARLGYSKGQDRVLEALLSLGERAQNVHLVLLGGTRDESFIQRLREAAASGNAGQRLHLLGEVADPECYYPMMDVVINSRVDAEPFGLSVVEAMMMGRPVVVHAHGGPAETVIDGVTGWHVFDPSVGGWQSALERVLADRGRWPDMGKAAREHAAENFSLMKQAEGYLEHLNEVAASFR